MGIPLLIDNLEIARALDRAVTKYDHHPRKWHMVKECLEKQFPHLDRSHHTYKGLYDRMMVIYGLKEDSRQAFGYLKRRPVEELRPPDTKPEPVMTDTAEERDKPEPKPSGKSAKEPKEKPSLLDFLMDGKRRGREEVLQRLDMTPRVLEATVEDLRELGYDVANLNGQVWLEKTSRVTYQTHNAEWQGQRIIRFAYATDTHLCSKFEQLEHLNTFYDRLASEGITDVYHAGDITDGYYKDRAEHIYELISGRIVADQQAGYVIDNYPKRPGITTHFITGNHDATHVKNGGADVGYRISAFRPDMHYLGYGKAKVWLTPKADLDIIHPIGGKAYALSYKLQKYIDAIHGGNKPRLLVLGHFHAFCHLFYRNIDAMMLPGFQGDSTFCNLNSLFWQIGGIIMEVAVKDDGEVASVKSEFVPYYVAQ